MPEAIYLLDCRLDWLTCTAQTVEHARDLLEVGRQGVEWSVERGDQRQPYYFRGYQGERAGHWAFGWGKRGSIVAVGGVEAAKESRALAAYADRWTRTDYCATVWFERTGQRIDEAIWDALVTNRGFGRKAIEITNIRSNRGGGTIQLGNRASAECGRVYDKAAESPDEYENGCWRWEVEYKQERAAEEHAAWRRGERNERWIAANLKRWFGDKGLKTPWSSDDQAKTRDLVHRVYDADRKLAWLETQVKPSVEFCCEARGEDAVYRALGLQPHVTTELVSQERILM